MTRSCVRWNSGLSTPQETFTNPSRSTCLHPGGFRAGDSEMKVTLLAVVFAIALHGQAIAEEDPISGPQALAMMRKTLGLVLAHEVKELKAQYSLPRRIAENAVWTDVVIQSRTGSDATHAKPLGDI